MKLELDLIYVEDIKRRVRLELHALNTARRKTDMLKCNTKVFVSHSCKMNRDEILKKIDWYVEFRRQLSDKTKPL